MKRVQARIDFYQKRLKQVLSINHVDQTLELSNPNSRHALARNSRQISRTVEDTRSAELMNDRIISNALQLQSQMIESKFAHQASQSANQISFQEAFKPREPSGSKRGHQPLPQRLTQHQGGLGHLLGAAEQLRNLPLHRTAQEKENFYRPRKDAS